MSDVRQAVPRAIAMSFVGLLALTVCLTWVFLAMRSVMDIGGSCGAAGTPRCPEPSVWLMLLGIFGGLFALGVYAVGSGRLPGPHLAPLAWSALFLSLGFNFLDYGLSPPGEQGPSWGWLVCAAMFGVFGGVPLLALRSAAMRRQLFWADAPGSRPPPGTGHGDPVKGRRTRHDTETPLPPRPDEIIDVEAREALNRAVYLSELAEAHRSGRLTDDQFMAEKRRILGGDDAT